MENFFKNSERLNAVNYFRKKASVDVLLCSKHASGIYKEIFWKTNFLRNYSSNVFECLVFEILKRIPICSNDLKSLFIDVGHGFKYVFHITCKVNLEKLLNKYWKNDWKNYWRIKRAMKSC